MIKKAILLSAILFASYCIFVSFFAPTWWKGNGNDLQVRSIKVEKFLYNTDISNKNIILGSSLSERIITDSIENTYNLGLGALGVFDGLHVLAQKNELPKCIFIEMNFINKDLNSSFENHFSNPSITIKKYIPSFREDRQPLVILGNLIITKFVSLKRKSGSNLSEIDSLKSKTLLDKLLANQKKIYESAPSDSLIAVRLTTLAKELKQFEQKGIKIIFFEVPNYTMFTNLPFCNAVRNGFYAKFPKSKYTYIDLPENFNVKTTDGLHLTPDEAKSYSSYLRNKIELLQL